jgi:hypothetical protein
MSTFKKIIVFILIIGLAILAFLYFGTYSEGTRAGIIMKISKRGAVIKTWEGQMNLETFGAVKDATNIVTETFTFSIERGNQELVDELNDAALTGERVNLQYIERYIQVFWRGDTKVFAVGVERAASPQPAEKTDETFPRR